MVVVDRLKMAKDVAKNWKSQYFKDGKWDIKEVKDCEEKYNRIVALGENPDPDKIDRIIGNGTWTYVVCLECMRSADRGLVLGRGKNVTLVCYGCLRNIFHKLFK